MTDGAREAEELMRRALALLDAEEESLAAVWLQQALDALREIRSPDRRSAFGRSSS